MNSYESAILNWQPIIGLEIHIQLSTNTKMFSSCEWGYGKSPNTLVCPLTIAYPGTLPVVNKKAVENAMILCAETILMQEFNTKSEIYHV